MAKKKTATKRRPQKRTVNKSEEVRSYMASNPDAQPKEVAEALGKKGIKVTPQAVSTIKFNEAKKAGKKAGRRGRPKGAKRTKGTNGTVQVDSLLKAKAFAAQMGGVDEAKQALDVLAKLS